jgi:iron complex transport system ATP-binding protein
MKTLLSAIDLSIGYPNYTVQSNLNLELHAGELVCLIGQNGSGKSTLMRTLAGLQKPILGKTLISGKNINLLSTQEKALLISMVLTDRVDVENARVFDIVSLGRYPHTHWWGGVSKEDDKIIHQMIKMVHLEEKTEHLMAQLSDGERQRAMIARALAQDTPIVLLDEPTAHLDLPNRVEIMLLLHKLAHETGKGILLSTHELDLALQAGDRIWLMDAKNGVECGTPEDLVFNGSFNRTFESDNYIFNPANGNFSMNYKLQKNVSVSGDKTRMYWTLRALARAGFQVVEQADTQIIVNEMNWILNGKEVSSVEELLNLL